VPAICVISLRQVAGNWSGFDPAWLKQLGPCILVAMNSLNRRP